MGNNIYIFTSSYKPVLGGLQTVCTQLAETLVARGEKVIVVTSLRKVAPKPFEKIDGVRVCRFNYNWRFLTYWLLVLLFFFKRPKAVYAHSTLDECYYIRKLRGRFIFKLVTCFHGHDVLTYDDGYSKDSDLYRNQKSLIGVSDKICACSNYLAKVVERVFSIRNVQYVYNGVDLSRFKILHSSPCEYQYVFSFGRLEAVKGFDLLIEAFAQLNGYDNLHLLIAGDGSQRNNLSAQIQKLGLQDRIKLIGRKTPEEVVAYAQNAKVIVIPSLREAFGIVVLEAIAAKRPIVAIESSGGIPEILDDRFGILVPSSAEGLRSGIELVLTEGVKSDASCVEEYLNNFSIEKMVNHYLSLIDN